MATTSFEAPVTAVMVTYQSAATLGPALAALRQSYDLGLLHCVVVDNASQDDTPSLLAREGDWAKIQLETINHGFGRSCNIGFAHVQSPYTLFVNPDATVEPDAIRTMLAFLEANPHVGIIGPATNVGGEGREHFQHTGPRPRPLSVLQRQVGRFAPTNLHPIKPGCDAFRTGWVCGAVLMIRTDLMRQLGGFDPTYFMYYEEMDLSACAEDLGYETWAVGAALAHHVGGASSSEDDGRVHGCIASHYYESRRHYLIKHFGWLLATATELAEAGLLLLLTGIDLLRGRGLRRIRPRLQSGWFRRPMDGRPFRD
jgi:N-acetylglucosaminyl-diphospho-decaprenol L-rhamnosyltransferase